MSEKSFDIESLLRFSPPRFLCAKCYGILTSSPYDDKSDKEICPICKVEYRATEEFHSFREYIKYLKGSHEIQFSDLFTHCQNLASISRWARLFLRSPNEPIITYPPIRALFESLQKAEKFVHFITLGISELFLGAIKLTAQRIDIRGIVSNPSKKIIDELRKYPDEAPNLDIKIYEGKDESKKPKSIPHNKLIIIDGLMAIKGSANLHHLAWRKAIEGHEEIDIVTDVKKVIELNNSYFSRIWSKLSAIEDVIDMYSIRDEDILF